MSPRRWAHLTPRYVLDRARVWWDERLHPDHPWLVGACNAVLDSWLLGTDVGFEWGGGRSTVWLAKRVSRLVSVDHDAGWHRQVCTRLERERLDNVECVLAEGRTSYVNAVNRVADGSLDFVLVDGKWRDECLLAGLPKLKAGGLLILDNADRFMRPPSGRIKLGRNQEPVSTGGAWREILRAPWTQRCIWFTNGVWSTAIFFPRLGGEPGPSIDRSRGAP